MPDLAPRGNWRDDQARLDLCQTQRSAQFTTLSMLLAKGGVELFVAAMRRSLILGGALVLGLCAVAAFRYQDVARSWIEANLPVWMGGAPRADFIIVSGNIEAHESVVSFKTVQSRIVELPFDEGAQMKAGTVIARVDRLRLQPAGRDCERDPQRSDAATRRRRAGRRGDAKDRGQRRSRRCAQAAGIRPRAGPSHQGRRHRRRPRRRGDRAQAVESGAGARQGARGVRRQKDRARHRQYRERAHECSRWPRSSLAIRR